MLSDLFSILMAPDQKAKLLDFSIKNNIKKRSDLSFDVFCFEKKRKLFISHIIRGMREHTAPTLQFFRFVKKTMC